MELSPLTPMLPCGVSMNFLLNSTTKNQLAKNNTLITVLFGHLRYLARSDSFMDLLTFAVA
jgi:hypothetical protein